MKKKQNTFILYLLLFIYLELVNKVLMFNILPDASFIHVILFCIPISLLLSLLSHFGKKENNKRLCFLFVVLIITLYLSNFLYFTLFSVPFSFSNLDVTAKAIGFYKIGLHLFKTDLIPILLFIVPFFVYILYQNHFNYEKVKNKNRIVNITAFILTFILANLSLNFNKKEIYSPYNLYHNIDSLTISTKVLGVFTSERLNIERIIFGFQEKLKEERVTLQEQKEKEYNKLNIDFDKLLEKETDPEIKEIYEYFKNKPATNKNEYTGLYKGKNLIFILAEGFNSIAVDKEYTPTLYKMIHEGFQFTNYYSPVFLSTTGGEFQATTGLIPSQKILDDWRNHSPYLPHSLGNAFKKNNYHTFSFHNWKYTYYDRDKTMPNIGFENYTGCGNGLEKEMNCEWLPSDVDLIKTTFHKYAKNSPFLVYYITVSGHAPYNFKGDNNISEKNKKRVDHLSVRDTTKAYLASQLELEDALTLLIEQLKKEEILEDTVIVLTGDHYPYTLTEEEINEISTYKRDKIIEVNHSNLILWNNDNRNVTINKVASQIDVLPTLLNLFGIEYDSRLLIGKDIFSDQEGVAIFSNRSWKSDQGTYYSNENKYKSAIENTQENYKQEMNNKIANHFILSKKIIEKDIYRKIYNK